MSRVVYDFLNDSLLFDQGEIEQEYADVPEARLFQEIEAYHDHVLSHLDEIREELVISTSGPKAYVGASAKTAVNRATLRRMVLYFDRAIIDDPLLKIVRRPSTDCQVYAQFFGYDAEGPLDRKRLADVATFLLGIRPLVGYNFLCIAPISLANEPPSKLGLSYSPKLFAERVPDDIRKWMQKRAQVFPLQRVDKGWGLFRDVPLKPCRAIAIEFNGYPNPMIFHLTKTKFEHHPDNPNRFTMIQTLSDEPPSQAYFEAWIQQSLNQFSGDIFDRVATDVANAVRSDAMLLTHSSLVSDLLSLRVSGSSVEEDIARLVLNLALPSIDRASESNLMRIRTDHGASFQKFRIDLERGLRDISAETNRYRQQRMLDELRHELDELRVREMRATISNLRRGLLLDTAIGALSLATVVPSGGFTLLGTIAAAVSGVRRVAEYKRQCKGNPGHFLWKLQGVQGKGKI